MSLSTEDMLHGAAILSLIQSMEDLDKEITYKISKGETKSCYELLIRHSNNINSLNIGLYIKRSRKDYHLGDILFLMKINMKLKDY